MNICDDHHDEVVYEGNVCPACELKKEISNLERDVEQLKNQIEDLNNAES